MGKMKDPGVGYVGHSSYKDAFRKYSIKFWKFLMTPSGAILTVYVLNVVGWGAMLFFLLLGVAPTMSRSTRLRWIEITSQIMNAFFCIAAFCPIPWRFRDFYYLLAWRVKPDSSAMMVLSHIHKGWFRLTPSEDVICGLEPETRKWKVDLVIYLLVANTLNQVFLCYVMWGYGPSDRPVWAVVLLVVLGCTFGAAAGILIVIETRRVKSVLSQQQQQQRPRSLTVKADEDEPAESITNYML